MKAAPFLIIFLPALALATGTTTDQITMKPQASPSCTSGRACIYGKSGTDRVYIVDSAGLELQSNAARSFRTSADCSALSSPANGDVCYDSTLTAFRFYAAGWTSSPVNDSLLVHKAGSETITGVKNFAAAPVFAAGLTASGAVANDFSGGSGTFKTSTGAVTIGPGAISLTGALALAGYPHGFLAHADTAAATVYLGGADRGAAAATQVALFVAPAAGSVRALTCTEGTAPGGIVSDVFTVQKSSNQGAAWSDTTSTVTITGSAMTAADVTHFPTVAQYDWLAVKIVKDGLSVSAVYNCQVLVQ